MTPPAAASKPVYVARVTLTHDGIDYPPGTQIDDKFPAELVEALLDRGDATLTKPK